MEVDQVELAMNEGESTRLVGNGADREGLVSQARGWPAVLGLAAGLGDAPVQDHLSRPLYEYLAEEVFQSMPPSLQDQLLALSLVPDFSPSQLIRRFGEEGTTVIEHGRECGLLTGEGDPEIHPLVRDFLLAKLQRSAGGHLLAKKAVADCLESERWDGAAELIERFGLHEMAQSALEQGVFAPCTQRSNRLPFALCRAAKERFTGDATCGRSRRRRGRPKRWRVSPRSRDSQPRAAEIRLSPIHCGHEPQQLKAPQDSNSRNSWSQSKLSKPLARWRRMRTTTPRRCRAWRSRPSSARDPPPTVGSRPWANSRVVRRALDVARHAAAALTRMRIGDGFVDSPYVEDSLRVLAKIEDPRARTSVMLTVTYCLALQCEFGRARELASQMLAEVNAYQLEFARPHADWNLAFVELGMRQFSSADRHLRAVESAVHANPHPHHILNSRVLRARLFLELARFDDAYREVRTSVDAAATPAMHGEYIATRALVLSLLGSDDEALEVASIARSTSISSEVEVLTAGVRSIVAAKSGNDAAACEVIEAARTRRTWEPAICCLRASPTLCASLGHQENARPHLEWLFARSNDLALARKAGFRTRTDRDPADVLSPRELEVLRSDGAGLSQSRDRCGLRHFRVNGEGACAARPREAWRTNSHSGRSAVYSPRFRPRRLRRPRSMLGHPDGRPGQRSPTNSKAGPRAMR